MGYDTHYNAFIFDKQDYNEGPVTQQYMKKTFVVKDDYSTYRAVKTLERIIKYEFRGFDVTNKNDFLKMIIKHYFWKNIYFFFKKKMKIKISTEIICTTFPKHKNLKNIQNKWKNI